MIFRSIRFRIILWNVALLTLVLVLCGIVAYKSLKWNLYRNLDDLLNSRALGVMESIDTYWSTEKQAARDLGIPTNSFSKINNINFTRIARHWVETEANNPELLNIIVQIFDNKGKLLVTSTDLPKGSRIATLPAQGVVLRKGYYEDISINLSKSNVFDARAFIIPVKEHEQTAYIIRLITPLSAVNGHLLQLRIILFCVLPLIILLTGIVGAFLARVSLGPVDQMITAIKRINSRNLRSQVEVPRTRDEIQRLAETFNSMLERINMDFVIQQRLIQDMSHEIKTPLTIMRGSLEVALKKTRTPERYANVLQDCLEQVKRLSSIAETLLVLAQFDNHEVSLQIKRFCLNDLALRAMAEVHCLAEGKQISLACQETGPVDIEAEESQIRKIFLNLLDNAVKYTPPGGKVTIGVDKKDNMALIEVKDSGIGINPQDLPHIFERFFRADGPGQKEPGFGLGLSLVKSIVETHRGTIKAVSQLGSGTSFMVVLPLTAPEKLAPEA